MLSDYLIVLAVLFVVSNIIMFGVCIARIREIKNHFLELENRSHMYYNDVFHYVRELDDVINGGQGDGYRGASKSKRPRAMPFPRPPTRIME